MAEQFDLKGARDAGWSDGDILTYLRSQGYDDAALRELGFNLPVEQMAPGPMRTAQQAATYFGRGGAEFLGLPGTLGKLTNTEIKAGPVRLWPPPTGDEIINATGPVLNRPDLVPQNAGERLLAATSAGVGAAVPAAAATVLSGGTALPFLAGGATGGLAAGAVNELMPDVWWAPPLVGLLGGVAGEVGADAAIASRTAERIAKGLGGSKTLQDAGTVAQAEARAWIDTELPKKLDAIWAPVSAVIPDTTPVPLTAFEGALKKFSTRSGLAQPLTDELLGTRFKDLYRTLQDKTVAGISGVAMPWKDIRDLRSVVGDALVNPKIIHNIPEAQLKELYRALTDDLRWAAGSVGPDAEKAFNAANAASTRIYDFAEGPLGRLVKGKVKSPADLLPEKAAQRLLTGGRAGGSDLAELGAELPTTTNELAAALIRYSPERWAKLSPEAKRALVPNARARAALDESLPGKATLPSGAKLAQEEFISALPSAAIGDLLGHWFGIPAGGSAGLLFGAAAPYLYHTGKYVATKPELMIGGGIGASAGNALFPATGDQRPTR